MKIIVVLVALTNLVKGLPQYSSPKLSARFNYDKPIYGINNYNQKSTASNHFTFNMPNEEADLLYPEIHKHIYVHAPPPELDNKIKYKQKIKLERPQKHYKIVFIKTPTFAPPVVNIPPPPQIEEKTLVYVLVKKPEEQVTLSTPKPTEPTKPEVYFIRYKSKKEDLDNGYERKIEVDDNNEKDIKRPAYLPPLTQLFSPAFVEYNTDNVDSSY